MTAARKTLFLDMLSPQFGLAGSSFPEKIEGLAFGPDLPDGRRLLTASGHSLSSTLHSSFFYVLSGVHAVHILGGLIGLTYISVKAWSGQFSSQNFEPLRLCATYWHFMAGVWLYLLLLLFFA